MISSTTMGFGAALTGAAVSGACVVPWLLGAGEGLGAFVTGDNVAKGDTEMGLRVAGAVVRIAVPSFDPT